MKRFIMEYAQGDYRIYKDSENGYYAVFAKRNGFWQQASKWYWRYGYAVRILNQKIFKNF